MMKMSFKNGITHSLIFFVFAALFSLIGCSGDSGKSNIIQNALPYAENALAPYISTETMSLHYGKHHAGYVAKTNMLLEKSSLKGKTLEEIVRKSAKDKNKNEALFNNAAQAWNHEFFWESMKPKGGGIPEGNMADQIKTSFGSYDQFKAEFIAVTGQLFGSGWVWLVQEKGVLKIVATGNADNPMISGQIPLFSVDVWEHAYYLDYQNQRRDYVKRVLENLIDWTRAEARMKEN